MSGEYRSTVTGSEPAELTFSPEPSTITIRGVGAPEFLAQTAHTAMLLKATIAELAAARARIEEVECERDSLRAAPSATSVETEQLVKEPADDGLPEQLGTEDIAEQPALIESDEMPAAGSVDPAPANVEPKLPGRTEEEEPADPAPASSQDTEAKPSREEVRRQSWLIQTEIIREIITHEDTTRAGRLDGHNISAIIRHRVQARTGISDKQWVNTWATLRQRKLIILHTYPNNIKMSCAVECNPQLIVEVIEKGELFTKEEDAALKEKILEMHHKKINPDAKTDIANSEAKPSPAPLVQSAGKPSQVAASAPVAVASRSAVQSSRTSYTSLSRKPPAATLAKSGRQRRQEEYDKRQREENAAWAERNNSGRSTTRRSIAEELVGGNDEVILPNYSEIKEETWKAITDDEVRFLLGLTSDKVTLGNFTASDKLLTAVVEAGHIDLNDNDGRHDPKKLPALIKSLKNGSQPKIKFYEKDGMYVLELTKEGEAYLANRFRQLQLADFRKKEMEARPLKNTKAA